MYKLRTNATAKEAADFYVDVVGIGPALGLLVSGGAAARHQGRVEATLAATSHYSRNDLSTAGRIFLHTMDYAIGIGGQFDCEGLASQRMTPFNTLGSGRWQATDGGAYREAARQAFLYGILDGENVFFEVLDINTIRVSTGFLGTDKDYQGTVFLPDLLALFPGIERHVAAFARRALLSRNNYMERPDHVWFSGTDLSWAIFYGAAEASYRDDPNVFFSMLTPAGARPERPLSLDELGGYDEYFDAEQCLLGWTMRSKCRDPECLCLYCQSGEECTVTPGNEVVPNWHHEMTTTL